MSLPFTVSNIGQIVDKYLRDHFIYMPENIETLVAPEYLLKGLETTGTITGDCDDISTLQAAIYKCLEIPVRFVAIRSDASNPNYDHVFTEVRLYHSDMWTPYDVTLPIGFKINYVARLTMEV